MPILGIVQMATLNILTQNVAGILKAGHLVDFLDIMHDIQPTLGAVTETDFDSQFDINLVRETVRHQYGLIAQMETPRIALFFDKTRVPRENFEILESFSAFESRSTLSTFRQHSIQAFLVKMRYQSFTFYIIPFYRAPHASQKCTQNFLDFFSEMWCPIQKHHSARRRKY